MKGIIKSALMAVSVALATIPTAGPAAAALILQNWKLDAAGVDGLDGADYVMAGIDSFTFSSIQHFQTADTNGNSVPDIGEVTTVRGGGVVTSFQGDGGDVSSRHLNQVAPGGFEITFTFEVGIQPVSIDGGDINFTHVAPPSTLGVLRFWIDELGDGSAASIFSGTGFDDGVEVARLTIVSGVGGGTFNFTTLDGTDDATFDADTLLPGVWFDENGADLSSLVTGNQFQFLWDQNIDFDPDGDGILGPSDLPVGFACDRSPVNACAHADGSFVLAVIPVPEPGSLGLITMGLLCMGVVLRRSYPS